MYSSNRKFNRLIITLYYIQPGLILICAKFYQVLYIFYNIYLPIVIYPTKRIISRRFDDLDLVELPLFSFRFGFLPVTVFGLKGFTSQG